MTTTALARANGRKPTQKQRVAQQPAIGNGARPSSLRVNPCRPFWLIS